MPPVITARSPVPSGRRRKMCDGVRDERLPAGPLVGLLGERALAPVDPAVRAEVRAVQVVGAAGQRLALEPLFALVGDAVAVGVGQLPDARRRGDVERAVEPHRAFGEHHLVGEDDAACRICRRRRCLRAGRCDAGFSRAACRPCRSSRRSRRRRAGPGRRSRRRSADRPAAARRRARREAGRNGQGGSGGLGSGGVRGAATATITRPASIPTIPVRLISCIRLLADAHDNQFQLLRRLSERHGGGIGAAYRSRRTPAVAARSNPQGEWVWRPARCGACRRKAKLESARADSSRRVRSL